MLVGETVLLGDPGETRYEETLYPCPKCAEEDNEGIRMHQITWLKVDGQWLPMIRKCRRCGDSSVLGITLQQRVRDVREQARTRGESQ